MAFLSGSVFPTFVDFDVAPPTGSTTTFPPGFDAVVFTNASTTAAQTVVLPANPADGALVNISNFSAITALTLSPTVAGAPAGLTAGQGLMLKYSSHFSTVAPQWYVFS